MEFFPDQSEAERRGHELGDFVVWGGHSGGMGMVLGQGEEALCSACGVGTGGIELGSSVGTGGGKGERSVQGDEVMR